MNNSETQPIKSHKDLDVWKKSIDLIKSIYKMSKSFPGTELYGIISQIRRASVSVPSNIAEGFGRNKKNTKEVVHFLYYSQGSLSEIETLLEVSLQLGYIQEPTYKEINMQLTNIRKMLTNLIKSLEK